jgi:mannosyl-oligosaccharide glucosidase
VEGNVKLEGYSTELGDFAIDVTAGPETNSHPRYD